MKYSVKGAPHKRRVHFACAACITPLESPLKDAGQVFACPTCGRDVLTPGVAELEQQRREDDAEKARREAEQREKAQMAAQEQHQREVRAAAERQTKEAQRSQRVEERAAARAKRRNVSVAEFAAAVVSLVLGVYFVFVRPLAVKLAATQAALDAMARTVSHNAEVANQNTQAVRKATAALAAELAETDSLARNANRHAHAHRAF